MWHSKKKGDVKRWLVTPLLVCLLLLGVTTVSVFADPSATETETVGDIYDISTAVTAYVNNVVGANGNDKHNNQRVEDPGNVGNAGAYVGYGDEKQGFVSFITSNTTSGSSSSTYDAWMNIIDGTNKNAAYSYARFGKLLSDAGLDETLSADNTLNIWRIACGIISLIVFVAGEVVPLAFKFALSLLKMFNVFGLFQDALHYEVISENHTHGLSANWSSIFNVAGKDMPASIEALVKWCSDIYDFIFNEISMIIIIPVLLAVVAFNILMLKKPAGTQFGGLLKRVFFIIVGVPICAALYTGVLDKMTEEALDATPTARLVAASFVDFESWADEGLPVDNNLKLESSREKDDGAVNAGGVASEETLYAARQNALMVNSSVHDNIRQTGWTLGNNMHNTISGGLWNSAGRMNKQDDEVSDSVRSTLFNMINRYTFSEKYTSSAWATKIASTWMEDGVKMGSSDNTETDTVRTMMDQTDEVNDWMRRETQDNSRIWMGNSNSDMQWVSKDKINIFKNGTMTDDGQYDKNEKLTYNGKLSDLSMYNYLSTSFQDSSLVTYSNATSVSEHVKQAHASVTATGNGFVQYLFLINMWVCIGITALLACYFAIGMTFKNLKTSFQLLAAIPMALMGVMKSIAQVCMYVIMMIGQVLMGALLYTTISEILVVLATVVENLVVNAAKPGPNPPILTSSILAAIGVPAVRTSMVSLAVGVLIETCFVMLVGRVIWSYRRVCVRCYDTVLTRCMRAVTLPEFEEMFETVWVQHHLVKQHTYSEGSFAEVLAFLQNTTDCRLEKGVRV